MIWDFICAKDGDGLPPSFIYFNILLRSEREQQWVGHCIVQYCRQLGKHENASRSPLSLWSPWLLPPLCMDFIIDCRSTCFGDEARRSKGFASGLGSGFDFAGAGDSVVSSSFADFVVSVISGSSDSSSLGSSKHFENIQLMNKKSVKQWSSHKGKSGD